MSGALEIETSAKNSKFQVSPLDEPARCRVCVQMLPANHSAFKLG